MALLYVCSMNKTQYTDTHLHIYAKPWQTTALLKVAPGAHPANEKGMITSISLQALTHWAPVHANDPCNVKFCPKDGAKTAVNQAWCALTNKVLAHCKRTIAFIRSLCLQSFVRVRMEKVSDGIEHVTRPAWMQCQLQLRRSVDLVPRQTHWNSHSQSWCHSYPNTPYKTKLTVICWFFLSGNL